MPPALQTREWKLTAVVLLLAASISAFLLIPFAQPQGLDFQNLYAFHHCAARNHPYLSSGSACGDAGGRDMFYPPLLYWSFAWVRLFPWQTALAIWWSVIGAGLLGSLLAWLTQDEWNASGGSRCGLFLGLMVAQYPVLFAIERANNDVLVLLGWTLAFRLYQSRRTGLSGAVAGATAALKIYPAIACLVVGLGLAGRALRGRDARRDMLRFAGAGLLAVALAGAAFPGQTSVYLRDQLPRFAGSQSPISVFAHPLHTALPTWNGWALGIPLLAIWVIAAIRLADRDPAVVFAGALAISSYFSGTSYDYNLITVYPLLVLLFLRSFQEARSPLPFATLLLGLLATVGNRYLFVGGIGAMRAHVAIQWAWLIGTGVGTTFLSKRHQLGCSRARGP